MTRLWRMRPLLWLALLLLAAILVSTTWERQTSYDDGGPGGIAFVVIGIFAVPWELVGINFKYGALLSLFLLVSGDIFINYRRKRKQGNEHAV